MMKKLLSYLFLAMLVQCLFYGTVAAEQGVVDCDPIVNLGVKATTLQKALSLLAERYQFDLIFPVDADRPVDSIDSMTLSQSLKYLTAEVNTIFQHEKVAGCPKGRLISLEVLPVGEDTEYVYVKPVEDVPDVVQALPQPQIPPQPQDEPVQIDDLELYAEEILLNKRKMDVALAPEQRLELREVMNRVRARLEAEGLLGRTGGE